MNFMIRKNLIIGIFCIVGALSTGCGKLGDVPAVPGSGLNLASAPATTDILVQYTYTFTDPTYNIQRSVPALKLVTALEFDTEKAKPNTDTTKQIYTFVGRALSNPASGTYELRSFWLSGRMRYGMFASYISLPPNATRVGYVYSSANGYFTGTGSNIASNALTALYEYAGGWTVNSNLGGQPIAYVFYTTDQDKQLSRNQ